MHTERRGPPALALAAALFTGPALAQTPAAPPTAPDAAPAPPSTARPEYEFRPLPADTFKPSEEIVEDFPVPFPVDI